MTDGGTIHVVDDDPAIRDSLRLLLESGGFTVQTHDGAKAFLAAAPWPDGCVLTDVQMPEIDGLELQRILRDRGSPLSVVVMSARGNVATAVRAMKDGALDFLEKPFTDDALFEAITRALAEGSQRRDALMRSADAAARLHQLTPRERQVLNHLAGGLSNKEIARDLRVSPRTVEVHRARVMEKLRVNGLPEAIHLLLAAEPGKTQYD